MPTVRRLTPQVALAPLPGVRRTAAATPASEGAGVALAQGQLEATQTQGQAQAWGAASTFAERAATIGTSVYAQMIQEERHAADETAVLKAGNALSTWENDRLYDPDHGAFTVRGEPSFALPEQVLADFDKQADEIDSGLSTPEQKLRFADLRAGRRQEVDGAVHRHVFGEIQKFRANELDSFVDNAATAAAQNAAEPRAVAQKLQDGELAIRRNGPALGLGPEAIDAKVSAFRSRVHTNVIADLVARGQDSAAQAYFEAARDQISGEQLPTVERLVEASTLRSQSQQRADAIIQQGGTPTTQREAVRAIAEPKLRDAVEERVEKNLQIVLRAQSQQLADGILAKGGTLTQQRDAAKAIADPELRDQVESRIEHEAVVQDRAQREAQETSMRLAYDILDRTHDATAIPATQWAAFDGSARAAMMAYADKRAAGKPIETDDPTYYHLMQMAADNPGDFATFNLLTARHQLDDGDFKQLAGLQLSIKNADRNKADKDLAPFRTRQQLVDDTLTLYGFSQDAIRGTANATPEDLKAIAQLRRMVDWRMDALQEATGKKATNQDIQGEIDRILSASVSVPAGSWWNPRFGGKNLFYGTEYQKRLLNLTIEDVPASDRSQIEEALRKHGMAVSDATILDLYLERLIRSKAEAVPTRTSEKSKAQKDFDLLRDRPTPDWPTPGLTRPVPPLTQWLLRRPFQ